MQQFTSVAQDRKKKRQRYHNYKNRDGKEWIILHWLVWVRHKLPSNT